jgi:hypothetical protein
MNAIKRLSLASLLLCASVPALAVDAVHNGALPVQANRIVGLWDNAGQVGPCGSGVTPVNVGGYLFFHAGGTIFERPRFPPNGAPGVFGVAGNNQRTEGIGTWRFNPATGQYTVVFRFDWFVDNAYHGYNVVERTLLMSTDGKAIAGPARSVRYLANGTVQSAVCGSATAVRLL